LRILLAEDVENLGDAVAARPRASGHAVGRHRSGTDLAARGGGGPMRAVPASDAARRPDAAA
jgi:hypothetical protein